MPNLLHLSDLHFGYDKDATAKAQRAEALDLLVKDVGRLKADLETARHCHSGDLTCQGKESGYIRTRRMADHEAVSSNRARRGGLRRLPRESRY